MTDTLRFTASVAQVKTLADGGIRVALDLSETSIDIAAALMQVKQAGAVLECAVIPVLAEKAKEWRENPS